MSYDIKNVMERPWMYESPAIFGDGKPSIVDARGDYYIGSTEVHYIGSVDGEANAKHIVHCVNHHEALIALAEAITEHFEGTDAPLGEKARALLAKVKP